MIIETQKYVNSAKEEIEEYLRNFKVSVQKNRFKISETNREKNTNFIKEFRLNTSKMKEILLSLTVNDFAYITDNYKNKKEKLYVFAKTYLLDNWGMQKEVAIYIKINMIKNVNNVYSIIVSFHKLEKNIKLLFENRILVGEKNDS